MIDPSAGDSWDREHERNGQGAFPIGDSKYGGEQDQRQQKRENETAAFEFFNERRTDQENGESNKKLNRGKATQSESLYHRLAYASRLRGFLHSVFDGRYCNA